MATLQVFLRYLYGCLALRENRGFYFIKYLKLKFWKLLQLWPDRWCIAHNNVGQTINLCLRRMSINSFHCFIYLLKIELIIKTILGIHYQSFLLFKVLFYKFSKNINTQFWFSILPTNLKRNKYSTSRF